jgi:hypothetical protein
MGGCDKTTWAREAEESPPLEAVARERVVKTQQAGKDLAGSVVICKAWRSAIAITVAARFKAWTVFARSNTGVVGSNATRGIDVCVRLFCVQIEALRRVDPPSKESYRLCID